ncbi:MAG: hypothetical protein HY906_02940, partial [Deltaproteobacteria bacterium]|nr:hypothetical protein [Deltaproteobacteria bacterium]
MSQPAVVQVVLQIAWLVWTPAVVVLAVRALRPAWPTERRALAVLLAAVVVAIAAVFALPFQVDASGVMGLFATPPTGHWKGIAGRALVGLWTRAGLGHFGVVIVARLYLLLAAALAAALLLRSRTGEEAGESRALLGGALVLLGLPSFT